MEPPTEYRFTPEEQTAFDEIAREVDRLNFLAQGMVMLLRKQHALPGAWQISADHKGIYRADAPPVPPPTK